MNLKIKPIEWSSGTRDGLKEMMGLDGIILIYECKGGTWRVWFEAGYSTSLRDQKVRNIPSLEEAITIANEWWQEWLADKLTETGSANNRIRQEYI